MIRNPRPTPAKPKVGDVISVLPEIDSPATVCFHSKAGKPMVTIIPLQFKPNEDADGPFILSCWGNGPGIVCFLEDYEVGEEFYDVEIIEVRPNSVIGRILQPIFEEEP